MGTYQYRVNEKYSGLDSLFDGRMDWDDTMLCGKKGVRVYTLTNNEMVELGSRVLRNVMQSVNEETVGAIILLAWNLRNPENLAQPIFPNHSPCSSPEDVELCTLSKRVLNDNPRVRGTLRFPTSVSEAAASVSYVCASLLRLFTKSVNNYLRALPYLNSSFEDFYHFKFPLTWYNPSQESLEAISDKFRSNSLFKYGMAGMIYLHNETPLARELREMLYEEHLRFTGMHAYTLFVEVQRALEVTIENFGQLLTGTMYVTPFRYMENVIRTFEGDNLSENKRRMTWKYARIFDSSFFTGIQTKNCKFLVYLLAYLSILVGIHDESVLQIVQIRDINELMKTTTQDKAQVIYDSILASTISRLKLK
ncbi:hypothetical protein AQUCO_01600333v1 [Aquilegia coerulea]|uniref:Uncharacterized protein n=1 Tax=Aquilegia coerulea TaxID=218851 RepID=A0A2G5DR43_AQUCA|nr:hypothetical protein AQUCO_01600333v1 [Aquilegia coerulea]